MISKEGLIQKLEMLSGPLALYPASREAVSHWVYRPTKLNDAPVEVITTIEVNYSLN